MVALAAPSHFDQEERDQKHRSAAGARPASLPAFGHSFPSLLLVHRVVIDKNRADTGRLGVLGGVLDDSNFHWNLLS
jgi:hypothetical protein